jgi:hypothetical protein
MPDRAADRRAEHGVMTGEMAGDAAERRTGQASGLRPVAALGAMQKAGTTQMFFIICS